MYAKSINKRAIVKNEREKREREREREEV